MIAYRAEWHEGVEEIDEARCLEEYGCDVDELLRGARREPGVRRRGWNIHYGAEVFATRAEAVDALIAAEKRDIEIEEGAIEQAKKDIAEAEARAVPMRAMLARLEAMRR